MFKDRKQWWLLTVCLLLTQSISPDEKMLFPASAVSVCMSFTLSDSTEAVRCERLMDSAAASVLMLSRLKDHCLNESRPEQTVMTGQFMRQDQATESGPLESQQIILNKTILPSQ